MKKINLLVFIICTFSSLHSMKPFNAIEIQFIQRAIRMHGISALKEQFVKTSRLYLKDTLCKPDEYDRDDMLAVAIFDQIELIESSHKHRPTTQMSLFDCHHITTKEANNQLGTYTHYTWEVPGNAIIITLETDNRRAVEELFTFRTHTNTKNIK